VLPTVVGTVKLFVDMNVEVTVVREEILQMPGVS
jgi:hypothetical protein